MSHKEELNNETCIAKCNELERTVSIYNKSSKPKAFKFDRVYGPTATQKTIYNDAITPIGMNLCLLNQNIIRVLISFFS